ncbi:PAS domain S-box protein, partial [candidate division KSB1 bacterium]|nr:PAS domain S-box protein [candidate division KSB1 bacterium]
MNQGGFSRNMIANPGGNTGIESGKKQESQSLRLARKIRIYENLEKLADATLLLGEKISGSLELALEEYKFEMGGVYLFEEHTDDLSLIHQQNFNQYFPNRIESQHTELKRNLMARFQIGNVLSAILPTSDNILKQFIKPNPIIKSIIMVAVRRPEKLWGLICLGSEKPLSIPLQELDDLSKIGIFLGSQIELFKLNHQLEELNNRHELLLNNTLSGTFILQDRKFVYANDRFARIHGYSRDEILHLDAGKLEWPLDLQSARGKNIEIKKKKTGDLHYECNGLNKENKKVWLEMKAAFIDYQNKPAIMGNIIDITYQKQVEQELIQSQEKSRVLLEGDKDAIMLAYSPKISVSGTDSNLNLFTANSLEESMQITNNRIEDRRENNTWLFEYFKKESSGELNLKEYHEMINLSDQANTIFFQHQGHNAMLGVLRSKAVSEAFLTNFMNSNQNIRLLLDHIPFSIYFYNEKLEFVWSNKTAGNTTEQAPFLKPKTKCHLIYPFCTNKNGEKNCTSCQLKAALDTGQLIQYSQIKQENSIIIETLVPIRQNENHPVGIFVVDQLIKVDTLLNDTKYPELPNEVKASAIIDSASDAIVAINEESQVVLINSAAENLFNWQMKNMVGRPISYFTGSLPDAYRTIFERMLHSRDSNDSQPLNDKIEIEMSPCEGALFAMEWSFSESEVQGKKIKFAFGRDITRHKQMESELLVKKDFLENIIKFNPYGVEVFDTKGYMIHNNAAADLIYGFKALVNYCVFDDLAFEEANVFDEIRQAFSGKIVTIGPLWYDTRKSGYDGIPHKRVYVKITFSPIRGKDGRIINVVAIHEDVTSHKEIENELVASERRYREVFETALDGIFRVDASGVFSFANPMMVEMSGYSLEELIGMPFKQIVTEKWQTHLYKLFDVTFKGAFTYKDEIHIDRKDGREVALEVSVVPISKDGKITELQAICRDISERKKAELELKESKELYTTLVEQSNDGVVLIRENGTLMFVNDGLCQLLGYKRNELLNTKFLSLITQKSKRFLAQMNRNRNQNEEISQNIEVKILKKDKSVVISELSIKKVNVQNKPIDMVHIRDISERKKAEEQIRILSTAVASSEDGVFITDTTGKRIFVNEALAQMFGLSRQEMMSAPNEKLYSNKCFEQLSDFIFPSVYAGKNWTGELEAIRNSGEDFPILLTISPIFDDHNNQLGTVGISKDITERKIIEEELKKKNQFLEKIIDLNPYGVQILDSEGRSVRYNKAFEKMFEPILFDNNRANFPLLKNQEFQKLLTPAYEGQNVSNSIFWINLNELDERIKENRSICLRIVLFPILDEKKNIANIVGLYEDITEHAKARDEIERHNRELTALYDATQAMVSIREPQALIESILRGAAMAAGTEFGAYFSYSRETNIYRLSTTIGFTERHLHSIHENFYSINKSQTPSIYWHGAKRNVLTPADMKIATELMTPQNIFKSVLWVPVIYEERLLGVFNLFSKTPDAFNEDSIRLVTMFADQAAVALENVRLYSEVSNFAEEMEIKIAERTRELSESEAKYRSIVENSPDLISIEDLDSRTLYGNAAFYLKLNFNQEDASEIGSLTLIHPEDLLNTRDLFESLLIGNPIRNLECRYLSKDKNLLHLLLSAEKLKLGDREVIQIVARDITEKKQLEISLKKSEEHHRALIDNVRDGVFTMKNNKIIWCNEQLANIFGYDVDELANSYFAKLLVDQNYYLNYEQELYLALAKNGHYRSENKGKRKVGEVFDFECSVSLIEQDSDGESELLVLVRDITERKRMHERLVQSEKLAATGKLAASIAHEINNPLQGIMASLAAIKLKLKGIEVDISGLDIIETGLKRISNIVKQLLSLHRPERQEKHMTDLNQVVEEVVSLVKSQLSMNRITLKKNLSDSLPSIYASSQQLNQILLNLILNAQESITSDGEIRIITRAKNDEVIIKIIDTGKGIEKEDLAKIFDPFFSTKKKMGTGLGLSIVHGAIEGHGGRIEVKSEV